MRGLSPSHLLAVLFGLQALAGAAQDPVKPFLFPHQQDTIPRMGDVQLTFGPGVERLLAAYGEHKHRTDGYRVQIFLGDRTTAETTKRTFLQKNPEVPVYLSWLAPNFRLRVGDCRTRLEAEHLLHEVKTTFPGSYIVPDEIEMPRVD
ncbi:MAG: SPOR domain-containing protein [Flavobacteriales bacterium]|nr:SPOR domain-containing protein [Flavobacteriales bacterium]